MVYTMFITLFLYCLWFFVKNSFESAKIEKKSKHITLISWPDARRPSARLQGCAVYLVRCNRLAHRNRPPVDMQHLGKTLVAERCTVQLVTTTETSDSVVAFHPFVTPHKVVVHGPAIVLESLVDKHIIDVIDLFHIRFWLPLHQ